MIPICVDLDGTLIRSDILMEAILLLIRKNPLYFFMLPLWLLRGKAFLKSQVAQRTHINARSLPYHQELLFWLSAEKAKGRPLWLATASNRIHGEAVAEHLGIFDGVSSSSDRLNLSGPRKAADLVDRFGVQGFDYCGNSHADLAIWHQARKSILVNANRALEHRVNALGNLEKVFISKKNTLYAMLKAIRPYQWTKNLLLFLPMIAAQKVSEGVTVVQMVVAFFSFSLCASSVYLLNDLFDLEADREHPLKRKRPFASGALPVVQGFWLTPLFIGCALIFSMLLPVRFSVALLLYYSLTLAYSFKLKRIVIIDIMMLALLYTVRIVAGAVAFKVPLSFWILLFSVFLFLSLALIKRYAELETLRRKGKLTASGRGYHVEDLAMLQSFGTSAGYMSVLVLGLYINSPAVESLYRYPERIWLICMLLLYWLSRAWMKAHRGKMHEDPLVFALRDKVSWAVGGASLLVFWMAR